MRGSSGPSRKGPAGIETQRRRHHPRPSIIRFLANESPSGWSVGGTSWGAGAYSASARAQRERRRATPAPPAPLAHRSRRPHRRQFTHWRVKRKPATGVALSITGRIVRWVESASRTSSWYPRRRPTPPASARSRRHRATAPLAGASRSRRRRRSALFVVPYVVARRLERRHQFATPGVILGAMAHKQACRWHIPPSGGCAPNANAFSPTPRSAPLYTVGAHADIRAKWRVGPFCAVNIAGSRTLQYPGGASCGQ